MTRDETGFFGPLTSTPKKKKFLVVDIESKDGDSQKAGFTRPFMVGVYDGESYVSFRDTNPDTNWRERSYSRGGSVDRALQYILSKHYRGWHIYAHNAGRFDYLHFLPWLMGEGDRLGFKFNLIPVASSIQVLDVWTLKYSSKNKSGKRKNHKFRFLDSIKLVPTSLDKAAKAFGLEGKLAHDLNLNENDPRWDTYLEQDCRQLYGVLVKFHDYVENVLCGEVGITAPSTAIKTFRRSYLKQEVPRSVASHDFVRESYVGGRVEAFEEQGENLRYYDINSSYPAAMLETMPAGKAVCWDGTPPDRLTQSWIGFCQVDVTVPDVHIPPLPIRGTKYVMTSDGTPLPDKLLFPTGRLTGTWEWTELQMALEMGAVINRWHRSWWFQPVPFFGDFVNELYKYRDKSNPNYDDGLSAVVKILLNSTYGKFGMKTLRRTIYRWDDPDMPEGAEPATASDLDSLIWYADEDVDAAYIMPQIAARVTALGRVKLHRYMMQAQELGGKVYYCDTDSIITDVVMPTTNELGGLKDEYPDYSGHITGSFLGPKLYLLEAPDGWESVKAKGLQDRSKENFLKLGAGGQVIVKRLEKVGTLARRNFQSGPMVISVPRTLNLTAKGKREKIGGGATRPYNIKMW